MPNEKGIKISCIWKSSELLDFIFSFFTRLYISSKYD